MKTTNAICSKLLCIGYCAMLASCASDPNTNRNSNNSFPYGTVIQGKKGYVLSPYNNKVIDVKGIPEGTLVQDPTYPPSAKKYFRVPGKTYAPLDSSNIASSSTGSSQSGDAQAFKKGAGAFLGFLGDLGVATAGAIAENPQLLASASGSTHTDSNAIAMQQLAMGSAGSHSNTPFAPSGGSYAGSGSSLSQNPNSGQIQNGSGNKVEKMMGLSNLGAAWMGTVNVACDVKGENPRSNETTTIVSAAPSLAKKYVTGVRIHYTVSGYDHHCNWITKSFEDNIYSNGPYSHYAGISHGCAGGLKMVKITKVTAGNKVLSGF